MESFLVADSPTVLNSRFTPDNNWKFTTLFNAHAGNNAAKKKTAEICMNLSTVCIFSRIMKEKNNKETTNNYIVRIMWIREREMHLIYIAFIVRACTNTRHLTYEQNLYGISKENLFIGVWFGEWFVLFFCIGLCLKYHLEEKKGHEDNKISKRKATSSRKFRMLEMSLFELKVILK